MNDTIAAISTAQGVGAISIIRVSGASAISIVASVFSNKDFEKASSHTIHYGYIMDGSIKVDEVLVSLMRAPKTFTREDVVEINAHGGIATTNKILEILLTNGCRLALPGEFTKRAFLNGRIDLTEAEGIIDLINSKTDKSREIALKQVSGKTSLMIKDLRDDLAFVLANIEVNLNYPEYDDIEEMTTQKIKENMDNLENKINKIIKSSKNGKILQEGIKTVIVGKPNAGKSSLLNTLTGDDRAIVTDIAGTTRDIIEETVRLGDIVLHLIDTAGIRNTDDIIEKIGVDKAKSMVQEAELVLYILDSTSEIDDEDGDIIDLCMNKKTIVLLNKDDLSDEIKITEDIVRMRFSDASNDNLPIIKTSMLKGNGIDDLKKAVSDLFLNGEIVPKQELYITNLRHKALLQNAYDSLKLVRDSISKDLSEDFYTVDLNDAYASLGEIIGEEVGDDLVEEIFSKFCMGK